MVVRGDAFQPGDVAVVTGAASGIGRAACRRFAELGLSVCLVDLPGEDLEAASEQVRSSAPHGRASVMVHACDVAEVDAVRSLEEAVVDRFGLVNILMNNAVTRVGRADATSLVEWRRAMEVNFWGVVHGVEAFMPAMLSSGRSVRIINVASKQGITNPPGNLIYNVTKSAVKTYTEGLQHRLRSLAGGNSIAAHLLIPGWTTTGKAEHRQGAWLPDQVVEFMIGAIREGSFYILCPDDEVSTDMDHRRILWAAQDIIENRPPLSRWHPDYKEVACKSCN
ncbi:MAG: SDR family NAD(P)-dependent oxidoreductase [Hyphomicrobiaceae bacterium]